MALLKCRFHPQAWINNYAIAVDPEGEVIFEAWYPNDEPIPDADTYESDKLREWGPKWIQDWHGPFYVEVLGYN